MIKPVGDKIAVIVDKIKEETTSGIYIPNKENQVSNTGEIVAVGQGRVLLNGARVPLEVAVGNRIVFQPYSGTKVLENGQEYLVMYETDVICVL